MNRVYVAFNDSWNGEECETCGTTIHAFINKKDIDEFIAANSGCCHIISVPFSIDSVNVGDKIYIIVANDYYGGYNTNDDIFEAFKTETEANECIDSCDNYLMSVVDLIVE